MKSTEKIEKLKNYFNLEDDVEVKETSTNAFTIFGGEHDDETYYVVDSDEALELAQQDIEGLFDDIGLDSFTPDFRDWVITEAVDQSWFEDACRESVEFYVEDIEDETSTEFDNRLIEELYDEGLLTESDFEVDEETGEPDFFNLKESVDIEELKEKFIDKYVEDNGPNYVQWYIDNYGDSELVDIVKNNPQLVDIELVAKEAIDIDGVAHFIARYDGEEHELGDDIFAYRID